MSTSRMLKSLLFDIVAKLESEAKICFHFAIVAPGVFTSTYYVMARTNALWRGQKIFHLHNSTRTLVHVNRRKEEDQGKEISGYVYSVY